MPFASIGKLTRIHGDIARQVAYLRTPPHNVEQIASALLRLNAELERCIRDADKEMQAIETRNSPQG